MPLLQGHACTFRVAAAGHVAKTGQDCGTNGSCDGRQGKLVSWCLDGSCQPVQGAPPRTPTVHMQRSAVTVTMPLLQRHMPACSSREAACRACRATQCSWLVPGARPLATLALPNGARMFATWGACDACKWSVNVCIQRGMPHSKRHVTQNRACLRHQWVVCDGRHGELVSWCGTSGRLVSAYARSTSCALPQAS